MDDIPIPQISHRKNQFIYIDKAAIHRRDFALTFTRADGSMEIPCAQIATLMLGPGTSITDKAIDLCADMGVIIVWVGESGIRYYAHGEPIARSSHLLIKQAELVSNNKTRLAIAKTMYQMRFPDDVVINLSMEQLRGKEGVRVKRRYQEEAQKNGIEWKNRKTQMKNISENDFINQAITMATSSLYGLVHSVVIAIGASPGLGFVHTGNSRSFVYDIADLYKTDLVLPLAFTIALDDNLKVNLDYEIRKGMRELFHKEKLLNRIVSDIKSLFQIDGEIDIAADVLYLWSESGKLINFGKNWGEE